MLSFQTKTTLEIQNSSNEFITKWNELSKNTVTPNPSYSAGMIIPALKYLKRYEQVSFVICLKENRLVAIFPLVISGKLNLKLRMWNYIHCIQTTPLIAKTAFNDVWDGFFNYISKKFPWQIIFETESFHLPPLELESLIEVLKAKGIKQKIETEIEKPVLNIQKLDFENIQLGKHLSKRIRQIKTKGNLDISFDNSSKGLQEFLELEHSGYKGTKLQTSILSSKNDTSFIREVFVNSQLKPGIARLTLSGELIAALFLIRDGESGFVLKTCFSENLAKYSPGSIIVEQLHLIKDSIGVSEVDSCVASGSKFSSTNWTEKKRVITIMTSNNSIIGNIFI